MATTKEKRTAREAAECLRAAVEYIKKGWCQGLPAVNLTGSWVSVLDKSACRWCASGAISAAVQVLGEGSRPAAVAYLQEELRVKDFVRWNDRKGRTQAEVIAAFEKAAERAEKVAAS